MSDISDWIQSYWFELGSLTTQLAILVVLVWYARKALRILSLPQGQAEAAADSSEPSPVFTAMEPVAAGHGGVGRMLSPMPGSEGQPEATAYRHRERTNPWHAIVKWLREPMNSRSVVAGRRDAA